MVDRPNIGFQADMLIPFFYTPGLQCHLKKHRNTSQGCGFEWRGSYRSCIENITECTADLGRLTHVAQNDGFSFRLRVQQWQELVRHWSSHRSNGVFWTFAHDAVIGYEMKMEIWPSMKAYLLGWPACSQMRSWTTANWNDILAALIKCGRDAHGWK